MAAAPAVPEQREPSPAYAPEQLQQPLVARPVDIRRPEDRVRHLGAGGQLPHHPLGRDLGPLVGVAGPERARLGRDPRGAVAVDPDRPAIHEALHPRRPGGFEQPLGPVEVHPLEELVALPALAHRDGEVEDMRDPAHRPLAELGVGDAPREDLHALSGQELGVGALLRPVVQPEHHDRCPTPPPLLRQVGPDEARPPGDQQPHPYRSASAERMRSLAWPSP